MDDDLRDPGSYRAYVGEAGDFPGHCYVDATELTWEEARDRLIEHLNAEWADYDRRTPAVTEPWMLYAREDGDVALAILTAALPGTLVELEIGNNVCLIEPDPDGPGFVPSTPPKLVAELGEVIAAQDRELPTHRTSDAAYYAASPLRITATRLPVEAPERRETATPRA